MKKWIMVVFFTLCLAVNLSPAFGGGSEQGGADPAAPTDRAVRAVMDQDLLRIPETVFPMGADSTVPTDRAVRAMGEKDLLRIPETVFPMGADFKPPM